MKTTSLFAFVFLLAGCNQIRPLQTYTQTVALKPAQNYTISNMPPKIKLHVRSGFPVDINIGDCIASLTLDMERDCNTNGDALVITDARTPHLFINPYNSVSVTVRY